MIVNQWFEHFTVPKSVMTVVWLHDIVPLGMSKNDPEENDIARWFRRQKIKPETLWSGVFVLWGEDFGVLVQRSCKICSNSAIIGGFSINVWREFCPCENFHVFEIWFRIRETPLSTLAVNLQTKLRYFPSSLKFTLWVGQQWIKSRENPPNYRAWTIEQLTVF